MKAKTVVYKREEIYERVWTKAVRKVAVEYGVSDVALAKMCRRLNVPLPGRGYWARVAAGQNPKRAPLAPLEPGQAAEVRVSRSGLSTDEKRELKRIKRKYGTETPIEVASSLSSPHELVAMSILALRESKAADDGIVRCYDRPCLAIEVAPKSIDRAMRIMDALIKALAASGRSVEVREPKMMSIWLPGVSLRQTTMPITLVMVEGELVPVAIEELTESVPKNSNAAGWEPPTSERRPTGRLRLRVRDDFDAYRFRLDVQRNWTDTEKRRAEDSLNAFVRGLVAIAPAVKAQRIETEQRRKQQEAQQREWEREGSRKELDERWQKRIEDEIGRWRFARDVREYIEETRRVLEEGDCRVTPSGELDQWLRWCDDYASRIDPVAILRRKVARVTDK
jgi:hypothetical protein